MHQMSLDSLIRMANTVGADIIWLSDLHTPACWNRKTLEMYLNPTAPENYLRWCLQRLIFEAQKYRGGVQKTFLLKSVS